MSNNVNIPENNNNNGNEFDELKNDSAIEDGQPTPEAPPEPELTPEERHKLILDKMKLKNKILRYKELFPGIFKNFDYRIQDLDQMEIRDLEYLLEELSVCVNTRNTSGLTKMLYFESVRIVEGTGSMVGLQINGLAEALKQNQAVHDVLNELSLKYENDCFMQPEVRLAYLTATTVLSLHKLNSSGNTINNYLSSKVPDNLVNDYKDL